MKSIVTIIAAVLIAAGVMAIALVCGGSDFLCGYLSGSALSTSLWYGLYYEDKKEEPKP